MLSLSNIDNQYHPGFLKVPHMLFLSLTTQFKSRSSIHIQKLNLKAILSSTLMFYWLMLKVIWHV